MNQIMSHPPEDMLLGYASGQLQDGFNMVLSCHINMCPKCRKNLHMHQEVAGEVMRGLEPTKMKTGAAAVLDVLRNEANHTSKDETKLTPHGDTSLPFALREQLVAPLDKLKWQKLSPGLKQHVFKLSGAALARLIWIGKGVSVPSHGHRGDELTLVLSGGYHDGEQAFTKGDLQWADHASPHQPVAMDDGPCLTLAVTDAPIVFQNILPRLLQPFFNI